MDLTKLSKLAEKAALAAGKIIAEKQGTTITTMEKQGGENIASCVVTEIDLKAEQAILEILKPTFNKIGLLAEESASEDTSRFEKDCFWCIDPLDGTLAFSRGEEGYSTSIALVSKDGSPLIGVVYNPQTNTLYSAIKNLGAFINGKPFKAPQMKDSLTLLYDMSYEKHPLFKEQVSQIEKNLNFVGLKKLNIYHLGGAVMNGISTIELGPAIYFKFPKKADGGGSLWDFAASSIIQSEAGGVNSDYLGDALNLNPDDTTFMNKKGIIYCTSKELLQIIPRI